MRCEICALCVVRFVRCEGTINRTIKNDYLEFWKPKNLLELKKAVKKAVSQYNNKRPHNSIRKMSPVEFENNWFVESTFNKPIITIFNNEVNV
ncbi:transposase [Myroides sp. 1354]|uniref:integrase core domain-containing protein n=1 Tax=Myroides sp. 1354 TaxID=2746734 RepID=UPI00258160D0|nr:transposase [Myroides sp. 1354]MDM1069470.1 transposase [Myroides sp. 1372]